MSLPQTSPPQADNAPVDAIELLRAAMTEVQGAFASYGQFSEEDDSQPRAARAQVARDILQRTRAYLGLEQAFVRATGCTVADPTLLREMHGGQVRAMEVVTAIDHLDPGDPQYDPSMRALGEFLREHADGEREGMFRHVAASRLNLFDLGAQLRRKGVASPGARSAGWR